jgi:4'-phosphopantetheinyl transferase EntD
VTNAAADSPIIESLFPEGVAAAELRGPGDARLLAPEEAVAVARAVPKRVAEFAAGRLCARRAMERLGVRGFVLRAASDRQPVWPAHLIGSISHSAGFCAAAIGTRERFAGLGLDVELAQGVQSELWPRICLPAELAWIGSLPSAERAGAAALVFSAKEAFYKLQYPLVGEHLDFTDLRVIVGEWRTDWGTLVLEPLRSLSLFSAVTGLTLPLRATYRFHEEFVCSAVALAANTPYRP